MARTVDFGPLTAPITRQEVSAWRRSSGTTVFNGTGGAITVAFAALFVVIWIFMAVPLFARSSTGGGLPSGVLVGVVVPVIGVLVLAGSIGMRVLRWRTWARIDRFARANGMTFAAGDPTPGYPGAIFNVGDNRRLIDHVEWSLPRFTDLGSLTYTTGSGKNRSTHDWGYLAMRLDRRLPNMVLDAKANNGLFGGTNLPHTFARDQVLSLEGDFDRYFTLYCPSDYQRDALYVFTPDLMALLVDEASAFDVEIIDDWMFVYSSNQLDLSQPSTWTRMFAIIDTVGAKTVRQTDYYADDRMPESRSANLVAPQGRRLRRGVPVAAIVVVVLIAVVFLSGRILPQLFGG